MTDIPHWHELVQVVKLRCRNYHTKEWQNSPGGKPAFLEYIQVPLNEYQMGNILEMLSNAGDTGDWYEELISIMIAAMDRANIKSVTGNDGTTFELEDLKKGLI
jgi:hypothetical protein